MYRFVVPENGRHERLARSRSDAVENSRLGRLSHWPVLARPQLAGFQVSTGEKAGSLIPAPRRGARGEAFRFNRFDHFRIWYRLCVEPLAGGPQRDRSEER